MNVLKGILGFLVVVLVVILGVGGYYVGFNHEGHGAAVPAVQQEQPGTDVTDPHKNQEKITEVPVVVEKQIPPEEYLAKMEESLKLIKEATSLIANDAYMANMPAHTGTNLEGNSQATSTPQGTQAPQNLPSGDGMDKIHQGIYKMAQGITIMEQNIEGMNREVNRAKSKDMSFYEIPAQVPQYRPYNPYYFSYPNAQYNPYGQPNQQYMMPNSPYMMPNPYYPNPGYQGATADPNNHGTSTHGASSGNLFSAETFIYVIYIVLIGSIIVGIFGMIGFIKSLLKLGSSKQGSDTLAG